MADMGSAVTTAITTGVSTDKMYVYRGAEADGSRDAYITVINLVAQATAAALASLGVSKIQAGTATRSGEGPVTITFDEAFSDANYIITGTIKGIDSWDGTEQIRFPPADRTAAECVLSIQSNITGGIGTVTVDWIAVELAS